MHSTCFPTGTELRLKDVTSINITARKTAECTVNIAVLKKKIGPIFHAVLLTDTIYGSSKLLSKDILVLDSNHSLKYMPNLYRILRRI